MRLAQEVPVHLRTSGAALKLARRAGWVTSLEEVDVGPGVVQSGPMTIDVAATHSALEAHLQGWQASVARGVEDGRAVGATLLFADAPPIGFEVARQLGVNSVGMANFSWSWAYAHYAGADPFFELAAARLRVAEGLATRFIALPGGGGLDAFGPARPELALRRRPTCDRAEARRRLEDLCKSDGRIALLSFGGYGDGLDLSAGARANPEWTFLAFAPSAGNPPNNLVLLPHDHGLPHQDLVLGADAIIAKPGYGTISECLNGPTPMVYVVPSGAFREHHRLIPMIERWLPFASVSRVELTAGAWSDPLERALAATPREPPPPDGLEDALDVVRAARALPPE